MVNWKSSLRMFYSRHHGLVNWYGKYVSLMTIDMIYFSQAYCRSFFVNDGLSPDFINRSTTKGAASGAGSVSNSEASLGSCISFVQLRVFTYLVPCYDFLVKRCSMVLLILEGASFIYVFLLSIYLRTLHTDVQYDFG